jgi:hypothetical protein
MKDNDTPRIMGLEAMQLLVKTYVANPGTEHQFISCVTPGRTGPIPDAWEALRKAVQP